jgi:hypothetical protein
MGTPGYDVYELTIYTSRVFVIQADFSKCGFEYSVRIVRERLLFFILCQDVFIMFGKRFMLCQICFNVHNDLFAG